MLEKNRDLKKIYAGKKFLIFKFIFQAHLWLKTMNELRDGVRLKKTNFTKTPIEYALTPFEMLMDDIRSRRYKLNKVNVDELPPKVKKDAHDVILEFIRSRPPLKPVSIGIPNCLLSHKYSL